MPKVKKVKNTSRIKHPLDLNKFPFPVELVKIIISYLPKKWFIPRIPKKFNSKIYHLRMYYSPTEINRRIQSLAGWGTTILWKHLFAMHTKVKIKSSYFYKLQKEYKYLVPHSKELVGKIVGYASRDHHISYRDDMSCWKLKHAFGDQDPDRDQDILYMVQFLSKHKYKYPHWDNSSLYHDCEEMCKIKDTKELPYRSCAFVQLEKEAQISGIYYLFPHQVRYYLDIEDREVFITKTNKVMFNYNI